MSRGCQPCMGLRNPGRRASFSRRIVKLLEASGVLEEITGRTWRRLYVARPVVQAIERKRKGI